MLTTYWSKALALVSSPLHLFSPDFVLSFIQKKGNNGSAKIIATLDAVSSNLRSATHCQRGDAWGRRQDKDPERLLSFFLILLKAMQSGR